jgi:hypothetical protein
MNREEWLLKCVAALRPDFEQIGFCLPEKIRASCSWPSKSALAEKKRRIGEAWSAECSGDETFETFISPVLKDPLEVAATLVHELCHCAAGLDQGHRGRFKDAARKIGLEGKLTATVAGEALKLRLQEIIDEIGPYPHAELNKSNAPKKQTTRMIKVICPGCGCIVRMTQKWLDEVGTPTCACGEPMCVEGELPEGIENKLEVCDIGA